MSYQQTIQELYIAYYGRPGDPEGLAFWAGRLEENDGNLDAIMDQFGTSDEFTQRFGDLSVPDLVNNLYEQTFGRSAETGGLNFYTDLVTSGQTTLINLATDIAQGAQNEDRATLSKRVEVANAITESVESRGLRYEFDDIQAAAELVRSVNDGTDTERFRIDRVEELLTNLPSADAAGEDEQPDAGGGATPGGGGGAPPPSPGGGGGGSPSPPSPPPTPPSTGNDNGESPILRVDSIDTGEGSKLFKLFLNENRSAVEQGVVALGFDLSFDTSDASYVQESAAVASEFSLAEFGFDSDDGLMSASAVSESAWLPDRGQSVASFEIDVNGDSELLLKNLEVNGNVFPDIAFV